MVVLNQLSSSKKLKTAPSHFQQASLRFFKSRYLEDKTHFDLQKKALFCMITFFLKSRKAVLKKISNFKAYLITCV